MNFFLNRIPPVNRAATEMAVADVAMAIFQVVLRPLSLPLELEPDEPLSKFVIRYILNITLLKNMIRKVRNDRFWHELKFGFKQTIFFIFIIICDFIILSILSIPM